MHFLTRNNIHVKTHSNNLFFQMKYLISVDELKKCFWPFPDSSNWFGSSWTPYSTMAKFVLCKLWKFTSSAEDMFISHRDIVGSFGPSSLPFNYGWFSFHSPNYPAFSQLPLTHLVIKYMSISALEIPNDCGKFQRIARSIMWSWSLSLSRSHCFSTKNNFN